LQQLLAHIREGLIDVVVVYKVDRLTRAPFVLYVGSPSNFPAGSTSASGGGR
jgi:DNA invertase Pin-like site-specific DNA recombinase